MKSSNKLRILAIGAHPDDCEIHADGQSGHHEMAGAPLVKRRTAEAQAAAKVAGLQSKVLPLVDGYLEPMLENRFFADL